jgi:hypothetical protein
MRRSRRPSRAPEFSSTPPWESQSACSKLSRLDDSCELGPPYPLPIVRVDGYSACRRHWGLPRPAGDVRPARAARDARSGRVEQCHEQPGIPEERFGHLGLAREKVAAPRRQASNEKRGGLEQPEIGVKGSAEASQIRIGVCGTVGPEAWRGPRRQIVRPEYESSTRLSSAPRTADASTGRPVVGRIVDDYVT